MNSLCVNILGQRPCNLTLLQALSTLAIIVMQDRSSGWPFLTFDRLKWKFNCPHESFHPIFTLLQTIAAGWIVIYHYEALGPWHDYWGLVLATLLGMNLEVLWWCSGSFWRLLDTNPRMKILVAMASLLLVVNVAVRWWMTRFVVFGSGFEDDLWLRGLEARQRRIRHAEEMEREREKEEKSRRRKEEEARLRKMQEVGIEELSSEELTDSDESPGANDPSKKDGGEGGDNGETGGRDGDGGYTGGDEGYGGAGGVGGTEVGGASTGGGSGGTKKAASVSWDPVVKLYSPDVSFNGSFNSGSGSFTASSENTQTDPLSTQSPASGEATGGERIVASGKGTVGRGTTALPPGSFGSGPIPFGRGTIATSTAWGAAPPTSTFGSGPIPFGPTAGQGFGASFTPMSGGLSEDLEAENAGLTGLPGHLKDGEIADPEKWAEGRERPVAGEDNTPATESAQGGLGTQE
ncbi:hypothetical protein FN846DRAFT_906890 [Sphaerosporella brunnea]|uniref:Uncharacterized protein n=1 Tax=Sphaerosporella brunnea TaxID=1250544 RepID=A0A5J5EXS8_9PEZI|nr:hypothetical protein FN846DRAFT_906890 [Sphaerosporella brunnea]